MVGSRGAGHGPHGRQSAVTQMLGPQLVHQAGQPIGERRGPRVLELGRPRVRRPHEYEQQAPLRTAAETSGSSASRPRSGLAVKASTPRPGVGPNGPGVSPTSAWA